MEGQTDRAKRRTDLPAHTVQFVRYLRGKGFGCGPRESADALKALSERIPRSAGELEAIWGATLVKSREEFSRFPGLYRTYFRELDRAENDKLIEKPVAAEPPKRRPPTLTELKSWLYNGRQAESTQEIAAFSPGDARTDVEFSAFSPDQVAEIQRIVRRFAHLLGEERSRRYVRSRRTGAIDLRRTVRQAAARNGLVETIEWRTPKVRPQRLLLLCDVSKSMDLYARFFVQFLYGFQRSLGKLETFVFATRLTRVTVALRDTDFRNSLHRLGELVPDWSGGTDLGAALDTLRTDYGHRYLNQRTTVLVVSDGWDQGDAGRMDRNLRWLSRRSKRILWINPLAGRPGYSPDTVGMRTALPYVERLFSAHNLETLTELVLDLRERT